MKISILFLFIVSIILAAVLVLPTTSFALSNDDSKAGGGLIPCGVELKGDKTIKNECTFAHFLVLINRIVKFIFLNLAIPIAAIMFFYAGFLMVTAGGESAQARGKAKGIFTNTVIGLVLAAGAWLIVKTVLSIMGYTGPFFGP